MTKLYVYAANMRRYLKGDLEFGLSVSTDKNLGDICGWVVVGECDVDLKPANSEMRSGMAEALDAKIAEVKTELLAKVELLEQEKKELLAIEYVS